MKDSNAQIKLNLQSFGFSQKETIVYVALLELGNRPELLEQSYNGQVESNTVIVPIDNSFPKYFLDHLDHFREIGWICK